MKFTNGDKPSLAMNLTSNPILTYSQSRELDEFTQNDWGIPNTTLMGLAAKSFLEAYREIFTLDNSICILCGKGNNGGDGYALGYFLLMEGIDVTIFEMIDDNHTAPSRFFRDLVTKSIREIPTLGKILPINEFTALSCIEFDILVDCVLGTGSRGELSQDLKIIQKCIRESKKYKDTILIALDHTSFKLDLDYHSLGEIGSNKLENIQIPRNKKKVIPIGFPIQHYLKKIDSPIYYYPKEIDPNIYFIKKASHKYEAGSCIFIGGSESMEGAIRLSSSAFMGMGGGIAKIFFHSEIGCNQYKIEEPSYMTSIWCDDSIDDPFFNKAICLVWGPGTYPYENPHLIASRVNVWLDSNYQRYSIIDGGAIPTKGTWNPNFFHVQSILTPHLGEFKRLLGIEGNIDTMDCISIGKNFCLENQTNLFIKTYPSIFINYKGITWVWDNFNPRLATMGTGDILTGILALLLTKNFPLEESLYITLSLLSTTSRMPIKSPTAWEILNYLKNQVSVDT